MNKCGLCYEDFMVVGIDCEGKDIWGCSNCDNLEDVDNFDEMEFYL